jgi:sulfonate transport system permease protein
MNKTAYSKVLNHLHFFVKKFSLFFLIIALWQILFSLEIVNSNLIPSPSKILDAGYKKALDGVLFFDVFTTIGRVLAGTIIGSFLGVLVSLILYFSTFLSGKIEGIIELLRPIPPIAWIPICMISYGTGSVASVSIVTLGVFFPVFLATNDAFKSFDKRMLMLAESYQTPQIIIIKKVLLRGSLPKIIIGIKTGVGVGWMAVIASEMVGVNSGLGYTISVAFLNTKMDIILFYMLLIGILGSLMTFFLNLISNKIKR